MAEGIIGSALESWLQDTAFQGQLVSGSQVSQSKGWDVSLYKYAGLWIKAASSGTPSITVSAEQSYDDTSAHYAIPEGYGNLLDDLGDTVAHVVPIVLAPAKYLRIVASGSISNPADVVIDAILFLHQ